MNFNTCKKPYCLGNNSCKEVKASFIEKNEDILKRVFENETIEKIFETLLMLKNDGVDFAVHLEKELQLKSPTSLKITMQQILNAKDMSLEEDLIMEYRMVQKCQSSGDFYEGVRAMLVDKDRKPKWQPKSLSKVDNNYVNDFFEPLGEKDLKIN
jgi:enoyl-CoA hydratase/carnithine racemase